LNALSNGKSPAPDAIPARLLAAAVGDADRSFEADFALSGVSPGQQQHALKSMDFRLPPALIAGVDRHLGLSE
jgi:hypothetical protein